MRAQRHVLAVLALLHVPWAASAQALEPPAGGAASVGLAGAWSALAGEPTSLWTNPAGVVAPATAVSGGVGLNHGSRAVLRQSPVVNRPYAEARDTAGVRGLPWIAISLPLWQERLWLGVGYRLGLSPSSRFPALYEPPGEPSRDLPRADPTRHLGTELDLQEHGVFLGLALRWRFLTLGAALELSHMQLQHQRTLWAGSKGDAPDMGDPEQDMEARLALSDAAAPGGVLGVLAAPHPLVRLGAAVHLPVTHRLEGSLTLASPKKAPAGYTRLDAMGGDATLDLERPLMVRGGVALGPDRLSIQVDVAWARWSACDGLAARLDGSALTLTRGPSAGGGTAVMALTRLPLGLGLQDQISLHAGLQSVLWDGFLTLRAGYAFIRGATRPEEPAPLLLDLDRHVMALGLELALPPVHLALAARHSFQAVLETAGGDAVAYNPLAPEVTEAEGAGSYRTDSTSVVMEVKAAW